MNSLSVCQSAFHDFCAKISRLAKNPKHIFGDCFDVSRLKIIVKFL